MKMRAATGRGALHQAVRCNLDRFPDDFILHLSAEELENWQSQIVISNPAAKMSLRKPPLAFTELGVAMLSSVLGSQRAIQMNIAIMRAFVQLRELPATHKALAQEKLSRWNPPKGSTPAPCSSTAPS